MCVWKGRTVVESLVDGIMVVLLMVLYGRYIIGILGVCCCIVDVKGVEVN